MKCFANIYEDLCDGISMLNSSFTPHLIAVMMNTLIIEIFTAYGVLHEFILPSKNSGAIVFQDSAWLVFQYSLQIMIAQIGSCLTSNAKETLIVIAKKLNKFDLSHAMSSKLQAFISQIQFRDLHVQNELFIIDWRLLVTVTITN